MTSPTGLQSLDPTFSVHSQRDEAVVLGPLFSTACPVPPGAPHALSASSYEWATHSANEVVVGPQPALPPLADVADHPLVVVPSGGPLVELKHPRIATLNVHWQVGWVHAVGGTYVRAEVAERLGRATESLPSGFGLAVFDAWRSMELLTEIYGSAGTDAGFANGCTSGPSSDPATPPPHLTGGAVDVTLTFDGLPLALGTAFYDRSSAAHTVALESAETAERDLRRRLFWAMRGAGFIVLDSEWWHFEFGTRRWAALTGNSPMYGAAKAPGS